MLPGTRATLPLWAECKCCWHRDSHSLCPSFSKEVLRVTTDASSLQSPPPPACPDPPASRALISPPGWLSYLPLAPEQGPLGSWGPSDMELAGQWFPPVVPILWVGVLWANFEGTVWDVLFTCCLLAPWAVYLALLSWGCPCLVIQT